MNKSSVLVAIIAGLCMFGSALVLGRSLVRSRSGDDIIRVVGSARKPIKSDFIIWRGEISRRATTVGAAYTALEGDLTKVETYLKGKGVPDAEIFPQAVSTSTIYAPLANNQSSYVEGEPTAQVERKVVGYTLSQDIEVRSYKVELLDDLTRKSSELLSKGVPFKSKAPLYLYTKLSDLKVEMQSAAAKDARERASAIAESAGAKLGEVRWARMSTPSLTPLYSGSDSDGGVDDTSSLEKKITAVVTVGYGVN
jgi:hypothetical protein